MVINFHHIGCLFDLTILFKVDLIPFTYVFILYVHFYILCTSDIFRNIISITLLVLFLLVPTFSRNLHTKWYYQKTSLREGGREGRGNVKGGMDERREEIGKEIEWKRYMSRMGISIFSFIEFLGIFYLEIKEVLCSWAVEMLFF